ncbi:MAG: AAA family ATPase [Acidimicrobiia bacterium]|nr:AAA family ATPase [Acidimicrobiia bacterium]
MLDEDGTPRCRVETWPIRTKGYVSACFTESTSRADDPQLHTHVVVGNRVEGVDGVWRAIDGRLLYRHKLAAGYLHEAELRSRLTERLGVRWKPVQKGIADIEGFTRAQIVAFSQRRQQIESWRDSRDLPDTPGVNEIATLATRSPKQDHPLDTLVPLWMERGAEVGVTPESVASLLGRISEVTMPDPEPLFDRLVSAEGLTAQASTFGRPDVIMAAAEALPEGGMRAEIEALTDTFLRRSEVVSILPSHTAVDTAVDLPIELDPTELERLLELVDSTKPRTLRRKDGEIFPGLVNERRYTTTELLTIEQRIINRAIDGIEAERWTAGVTQVEAVLAAQPNLTDGQRAMVHRFANSGSAIDVGVGAAGTGKTTVMGMIGDLAAQTGTPVVGTALAARAAAGFETATGISSTTITRFLWETKAAGGLPYGAVVVVDESGMVGSRQLAEISDLVEAASGKLILIGDHHQLAEIDAGGLFAALVARLPTVELSENVRQDQEWERTALTELRQGSASRAVAMYNRRGKINVAATDDDTLNEAVDAWYRDVEEIGDPAEVLLIGHLNTTVDELNQRARTRVFDAGLLRGPTVNARGHDFQSGDRVVCLKNRSRLGVLNGDLGTVTGIDVERRSVTIQLDRTSQPVTVPHWYLDDGNLDWGYALTGHKAQGATAQRAHTVAGDGVDREWIYVTMSRGREANTIYLTDPDMNQEECEHLAHQHPDRLPALIAALARTATEPAAHDAGRGPETLTDEQLKQRLAEVKDDLATSGVGERSPEANDVQKEPIVEYLNLKLEIRNRHRDSLATIAYQPPDWVINTLGERPADPGRRAVWDAVVDRALRYRTEHDIPDDAAELLGPPPPSNDVMKRVAWIAARRATEGDLRRLTLTPEHGRSAIGR